MKTKILFLFLFVALFSQAQRPSIIQPSLKDSNMQLDSIYATHYTLMRRDIDPYPMEKWYVKAYDADKNPTEFITKYYYNGSLDSLKYVLSYGDLDKSANTFEHSAGFKNYLPQYYIFYPFFPSNYPFITTHVFDLFNLTGLRAEEYDPVSQQWRPIHEQKFLSDLRMPEAYNVSFITYTYDANNNVITHNKITSILDSFGYPSEKTIYNYNQTIQKKEIFYNTYDANGRLIETIRKDITDFNTNTETPYYKYTFNYGTDTFEKISYTYDNGQWVPYQKKYTTYSYYNTPSTENYEWINNQWEFVDMQNISGYLYGLYRGYYYPGEDPTTPSYFYLNYEYNNCNLVTYRSQGYSEDFSGEDESINLFYSSTSAIDCVVNSVEEDLLNKITVHPNPAKDKIYINSTGNFDYTLYSLQGKLLSKGKFNSQLDVSNLQDGVYILNLTNSTTTVNHKIILKR